MTLRNNPVVVCIILVCSVAYVTLQQAYWGLAPNYSFDENWHAVFATLSPAWRAFLTMSDDTHPFLYYLFLRPFAYYGGDPFFPRLLSIIPTILTIPLWYQLLLKLRIGTGVALITTVVLAVSYPFLDMGVTVRSYSLTVFLLLLALWFWADMLPGSTGRPSRWSSVLSLVLFGMAFLCLYAAGFVAGALLGGTMLVMVVSKKLRIGIMDNWRRHGGWSEWVAFLLLHLVGVGWFLIGLRNELDSVIPGHVRQFVLVDGQSISDFLVAGLRQELALFTSFSADNYWLLDAAWLVILVAAMWQFIRAVRHGNAIAAVVAMSPILLTAILAIIGLAKRYPFGGELRHQYVLFPFLLLLLALVLDSLWRRISFSWAKAVLAAVVVALALTVSLRTLQMRTMIGEAPPNAWWGEDFRELFETGTELPVIIPQYTFYSAFMHRWPAGIRYRNSYNCSEQGCTSPSQGWRALIEPRPEIQEYLTTVNGGKDITILSYQMWMFPAVPSAAVFKHFRSALQTIDATGARIFSPNTDPDRHEAEDALRKAAAQQGFSLSEYLVTDQGVIWSIEMEPQAQDQILAPGGDSRS